MCIKFWHWLAASRNLEPDRQGSHTLQRAPKGSDPFFEALSLGWSQYTLQFLQTRGSGRDG